MCLSWVSVKCQDYMKALFVSLASIHELRIIHRDIKLGNCLYNYKGRNLKLIDFGLAQISYNLETTRSYDVPSLSVTEIVSTSLQVFNM